MVEIKPLNEIADTVERFGEAVVALEAVPGEERAQYRKVVADTFDILQQAISLPANRLTKLLAMTDENRFADELVLLAEFEGWERLERAASLCEPLRACGREMDGLFDRLKGRLATRHWKRLRELTEHLLGGEAEFAYLISASLRRLSGMADAARSSPAGFRRARQAVERTRDHLQDLRRRLLAKQVEFYEAI